MNLLPKLRVQSCAAGMRPAIEERPVIDVEAPERDDELG